MTERPKQLTWPRAIQDAARDQSIPLPTFERQEMGIARSATMPSGRFVTFKRRLVPREKALRDGVQWSLWESDKELPKITFRLPLLPEQGVVLFALRILKGWLLDNWTLEESRDALRPGTAEEHLTSSTIEAIEYNTVLKLRQASASNKMEAESECRWEDYRQFLFNMCSEQLDWQEERRLAAQMRFEGRIQFFKESDHSVRREELLNSMNGNPTKPRLCPTLQRQHAEEIRTVPVPSMARRVVSNSEQEQRLQIGLTVIGPTHQDKQLRMTPTMLTGWVDELTPMPEY